MKRYLRFSLTSFLVLVTAVALLFAPLLARRNHLAYFQKLHENVVHVDIEFSAKAQAPLERWLAETPLKGMVVSETWTISDQVEAIQIYRILPVNQELLPADLLRKLAHKIPQCNGLVAVDFFGEIPEYFARSLQRNGSLAHLNVNQCSDCQHIAEAAEGIVNLQVLLFDECVVTNEDMKRLAACDNLQFIFFAESEVPPDSIETLRQQLPACQICCSIKTDQD